MSVIEIEGIVCNALSVAKTGILPGEMYLARRNTGWKLLTCAAYHPYDPETCGGHDGHGGRETWCGLVFPEEPAYPFNDNECFKIEEEGASDG